MKTGKILIGAVVVILTALLPISSARAAMLTYTFDDGPISVYDNAYSVLGQHGQTGVVYAISERTVNYYNSFISASQLLQMQATGWEIGSHSMKHAHLTQIPYSYEDETLNGWDIVSGAPGVYRCRYSYDDMSLLFVDGVRLWGKKTSIQAVGQASQGYYLDNENDYLYMQLPGGIDPNNVEIRAASAQREIEQSFSKLSALGLDIGSFVAPYGDMSEGLMEFVWPLYDNIIGSRPLDQNYNLLPLDVESDFLQLTRTRSIKTENSVDDIVSLIEEAAFEDAWIILTFHGIYESETDPYSWSPEKFEALASYVETSGIDVVTIAEGVASLYPVPVPGAVALLLPALGIVAIARRKMNP